VDEEVEQPAECDMERISRRLGLLLHRIERQKSLTEAHLLALPERLRQRGDLYRKNDDGGDDKWELLQSVLLRS
jgi:hypothetical protein